MSNIITAKTGSSRKATLAKVTSQFIRVMLCQRLETLRRNRRLKAITPKWMDLRLAVSVDVLLQLSDSELLDVLMLHRAKVADEFEANVGHSHIVTVHPLNDRLQLHLATDRRTHRTEARFNAIFEKDDDTECVVF